MLKDEVINGVIMEMTPHIESENILRLKNALITCLYDMEVVQQETSLTTGFDDTYRFIELFAASMQIEALAQSTIYQYTRAAIVFCETVNKNFRDITSDDVLCYFAKLYKSSKMSSTSMDNHRKFIKAFFTWCTENDYISKNPFNKMKKIQRVEKKKEILTDKEIVMLRDSCRNDLRSLALIDFLLSTGVRVSECSALNISDINFETNEVQIFGQKTNTWRTVYLDEESKKHLLDYLMTRKDKNQALFLDAYKRYRLLPSGINRLVKMNAKNALITKHCTVHLFRKTLATRMYRKGLGIETISNILGHSPEVCSRYYLKVDSNKVKHEYFQYA